MRTVATSINTYLALSVLVLALSSCASAQNQAPTIEPSPPFDNFSGTTIQVERKIIVKEGETFDGKGNLYEWVGEGDCSQTEGMPAMFVLSDNSTLKNLWMKNAPDGIHAKGSNIAIDNIVNVDVCEDAISIKKNKQQPHSDNIKITNSRFYHCEDKAIQLTRGSNILIENNEFYKCAKAVRVKEQARDIVFKNNRVFEAKHAVKATGGNIKVMGNYITKSRSAFWSEKGATIIDDGSNTLVDNGLNYIETENGRIITP